MYNIYYAFTPRRNNRHCMYYALSWLLLSVITVTFVYKRRNDSHLKPWFFHVCNLFLHRFFCVSETLYEFVKYNVTQCFHYIIEKAHQRTLLMSPYLLLLAVCRSSLLVQSWCGRAARRRRQTQAHRSHFMQSWCGRAARRRRQTQAHRSHFMH